MNNFIFYEIKEYEKTFFEQELYDKFNLEFKEEELTPESDLNFREENAEIISVFTGSRLTKETLLKFQDLKLILFILILLKFHPIFFLKL